MNRSCIRWACLSLAACSVSATLVGCDNNGESKALDLQAAANASRTGGGAVNGEVASGLRELGERSDPSPGVIQAQQTLGHLKMSQARQLAAEAATLQRTASMHALRIGVIAQQAHTSLQLAGSYRQLDPAQSLEQIKQLSAQARGDGNAAKFVELPNGSIPSLAAVQQERSRLEGELAKQSQTLADVTTQRDAALTKAGEAAARADTEKGDARVETVKQTAGFRQQAAVLSRQINELNVQIAKLKGELDLQTALQTRLSEAVAGYQTQGESIAKGWTEVSAQATQQDKLARAMVGGEGGAAGESAAVLVKKLDDSIKALDAKRGEVVTAYEEAIAAFSKAAELAGKLSQDVDAGKAANGQAFEADAWEADVRLLAADRMNLDKALAEKELAGVLARQAGFLAQLYSVARTAEALGDLSVQLGPVADPQRLSTETEKAIKAADEGYATADSTLEGIQASDEALAALRPIKAATRILALYERAQLGPLSANVGVAPDVVKASQQHIDDAKAAALDAQSNNLPMPRLPAVVAAPPAPPKPVDAPTAAAAPTPTPDAPADEAAVAAIRAAALPVLQAAFEGNADSVKAASVVEAGGDEHVQAEIDRFSKLKRLRTAVESKFPDDPAAKTILTLLTPEMLSTMIQVTIEGDKAYVQPRIADEVEDFRNVEGTWKRVFAAARTDAGKAKRQQDTEQATAIDAIAGDVESGAIADVNALSNRLGAAMNTTPAPAAAPAPGAAPTPAGADTPAPTGVEGVAPGM